MKLRPLAHPEDVRDLPAQVKRDLVAALLLIEANPLAGRVLDPAQPWQKFESVIAGLRVGYVPGTYEDALRVVYRVHEEAQEVEIVAIGPRLASAAYRLAAARLRSESEPTRRPVRPARMFPGMRPGMTEGGRQWR